MLPEAEDVDVHVDPNDLQVDVYRSSGPGGQSVNTTDSAVRITHKPSGVVVSMQDEKSQLQNREKAMRVLRARLYERALAEQQAELAADRRSQVGTGDRAEKIRTYNYGERRVTDHRVKVTQHNLDAVLEGELDGFTDALARRREAAPARGADVRLPRGAGPRGRRARRPSPSAPPAATRPGSTPSCCSRTCSASTAPSVVLHGERPVEGPAVRAFQDLVRRRSAGHEPVAYLVGRRGFRRLDLDVDPRVLIPRPETETLVEVGLELPAGARVVDVGTGSGAVALALKDERPDLRGRWPPTCPTTRWTVARANAARLGLDVAFVRATCSRASTADVDAVLANPPYVAEAERAVAAARDHRSRARARRLRRRGRPGRHAPARGRGGRHGARRCWRSRPGWGRRPSSAGCARRRGSP